MKQIIVWVSYRSCRAILITTTNSKITNCIPYSFDLRAALGVYHQVILEINRLIITHYKTDTVFKGIFDHTNKKYNI
jgi:hypothetical protein